MSARVRKVAWVAAALVVPVVLAAALLPLRDHVDDVLVAVVLLAVSSAVLARAEWPPRIVAGVQQRLVTVSLSLGGVRDRVPEGLPAIRDDLDRLADILAETLRHGPYRPPAPGRPVRLISACQLAGRPEFVVAGVGPGGSPQCDEAAEEASSL